MGGLGELVAAWPSVLLGGGLIGGPGSLLALFWAHKRASRKQTDNVSIEIVRELKTLVASLQERIAGLEGQVASERRACDAQMAELRETIRADSAEAEVREDRLLHRLKNREQELDGLLLLIELAPEKAPEAVARIKERRAQKETEHA